MFYEPSKGHGLPHDPSKAIVAPRPIGWISTLNGAGEINLAPYSFFNAVSTRPFIVWFSSEGEKDSASMPISPWRRRVLSRRRAWRPHPPHSNAR